MIRRLGPDEGQVLKQVRLAALADAPSAFCSSHEREAAFADEQWDERLRPESKPTFVWESEGSIDGMVTAVPDAESASIVHLMGMWVAERARGGEAAGALVDRVLAWAAEVGATTVRLHVLEGNDRAERLYTHHGFVRTGRRSGEAEIEMERPAPSPRRQ